MFRKLSGLYGVITRDGEDGGAGGGAAGTGDQGGTSHGNASGNQPVTFTPEQQAVIDQLIGDRAQRASEAATKKLLGDLGLANVDELKATVEAKRKADKAALTEMDRLKTEATEANNRATAAEAAKTAALEAAQKKLIRAALQTEATKPEYRIRTEAMPDVWAFISADDALLKLIKAVEGKEDQFTGMDAALKALIKVKPYLVEVGNGTPRPGDRRSSGGSKEIKTRPIQL